MSLACVYHKTQPMRVVEDDVREEMVATGEWFKHPLDVHKIKEEGNHEKQIRQRTGKRRNNGQDSPNTHGSGT